MTQIELPDIIYVRAYGHQDDGSLMLDAEPDPHPKLTKYVRADLMRQPDGMVMVPVVPTVDKPKGCGCAANCQDTGHACRYLPAARPRED